MKKISLSSIFVVALIAVGSIPMDGLELFSIQNAYGGVITITPASITFMGNQGGCKVFEIRGGTDSDGVKSILFKLAVVDTGNPDIARPSTVVPGELLSSTGNTDTFIFELFGEDKTTMATLKVCPIVEDEVEFEIIIASTGVSIGKLIVLERIGDAEEGNNFDFQTTWVFKKEGLDCDSIRIGGTNFVGDEFLIFCEPVNPPGVNEIKAVGTVADPSQPAIGAISVDPLGDTFLLIADLCILNLDNSFVCPIDFAVDFLVELPTIANPTVGGTLISIDTTTLVLAGTQMNAAWMIPVLVSAIGIGIVIARKL